ncbi:MAG TPA: hypothetical protein VGC55_00070, partial [Dokdonella sp.]
MTAAAGAIPLLDASIDTHCDPRRSNPAAAVLDCHARHILPILTDPMTAAVVRPFVALAVALAIAGCSIPAKPDRPVLRNEAPLAGVDVPAGAAWPEAEWWKRYADAQLDELEAKALAGSPSLDEAHKRFDTAIRSIENARAASALSSQLNGEVQRNRLSQTLGL